MENSTLHIFSSDTIAQYKIIEHILKEYGYTDEREFKRKFTLEKLDNNKIKLVDSNGNKKIYTYNEDKTITKEEVL